MLLALIEDCIRADASANLCKTVADSFFMETSIFVTDLAQQFSLSVGGPSHPVVVPLRVARAGRRGFSDLGLSFLSACQQLASSFSHFASALPRRAMIRR
jgi:hypothetical protein